MKAQSIAFANVRRLLRDRSNIFFVFIFPLVLVLFIGVQFGGDFSPKIGVLGAAGEHASAIVDALEANPELTLRTFDDQDELSRSVERGAVAAAVIFPADYETKVGAGEQVSIGFVARNDGFGPQLQAVVGSIVDEATAPVSAAGFVAGETEVDFAPALAAASALQGNVPSLIVEASSAGERLFPETLGQFDLGASSQLVLFMFLTGLTGSAAIIQTRRLGVATRMLSTPTSIGTILTGEGLGRFAVVVVQGVYIMVAALLIFRVNFGDPIGAIAILIAFALVGAGAGMLVGSIFEDDGPAIGVSIPLALGLAALGGSMMPTEFFSETLLTVSKFTPHFWANDAFAELVRNGASVVDILPQIGVLLAFAVALLAVASWRLQAVLTR